MDMDTAALALIQDSLEEMRKAAMATDARQNEAREALRDTADGFRHFILQLVSEWDRKSAAQMVGVPLRRACAALSVVI